MLTWEDDMEVHALRKRGWSISAIARHTGHDRKTVRKYLAGEQKPGVRARPSPDPFDPFVDYVTARLVEDRLAADGLGVIVRDSGHVIALDAAAMASAATGRPHRRKE